MLNDQSQVRTPDTLPYWASDLATLARVRDRLAMIDRDEPFRGLSILDLEARWIAAGWELAGRPQ
jgi:hypothetical protein